MNITDDIKEKVIVKEMNEKYMINSLSIVNVPVIAVFEDGKLKNIYSIKNNNYDIEEFKMFINNNKFRNDDDIHG